MKELLVKLSKDKQMVLAVVVERYVLILNFIRYRYNVYLRESLNTTNNLI